LGDIKEPLKDPDGKLPWCTTLSPVF
jgi:hypothetical protein